MTNTKSVLALQQDIQQQTGFSAVRVETSYQLNEMLEKGLASLYKDVFAGPPYNEKFELEEVKNIFREFLDKKGIIFVATDPAAENRPIAFVVSIPLRAEFELAKIADEYYADPEKTAYFAEDGVAEGYRRRGLSGQMKNLLLEANSVEGMQKILLRTSTQNYAQISAVNKASGRVLLGQSQKIIRKTTDDKKVVDKNLFYLFNAAANENKKPTALKRVIIVETSDGKNRAYVFGENKPGLKAWFGRQVLRDEIKCNYPDIDRVKYVDSLQGVDAGKILFDGRMYVNPYLVTSKAMAAAASAGPR